MQDKQTKAEFCQSLDWQIKIAWFDLTGIHRLDDGRVVKVELHTHGVSNTYPGFLVTVVNKREGEVDRKYFLFDDYLDCVPRADSRKDYDAGYCVHGPRWHWYIAEPKVTRPFCAAVEAYVEQFR